MPLNRPALTLGTGPSGVHEARRWVVTTCQDIGRADLLETTEMGVSELVTNALLHGAPPIRVRVRGTHEHPRVEVLDASVEPPVLPGSEPFTEGDEFLLTFGRGLDIVARCSDAWGAEIEDDGKVVWFTPAVAPREDRGATGVITGGSASDDTGTLPGQDLIAISVRRVPLRMFVDFQVHYRELRREVRLLALSHEADYPLAKSLSDLFGQLDRVLRGIGGDRIEAAQQAGETTTDLVVEMPSSEAANLGRFLELLDLADAFCREERLLSLARSPEQREFQRWFLQEFIRQQQGELPVPWSAQTQDRDQRIVS